MFEWIKTIIILPFNVLVLIPAIVLYFTGYKYVQPPSLLQTIFGAILLLIGLFLAGWTMRLFNDIGKGTAAPWNPPKHLVVEGPYCYVRNPMITSVLFMTAAEALILNSAAIFWLLVTFYAVNSIYFPLFEEKGLAARFGEEYLEYKANVPRWIPRLTKWQPTEVKRI